MDFSAAGLMVVVGAGAAADLAWRRIPNALTLTGLGLALALRSLGGGSAVVSGLIGACLGLALSLPLFALGGMGGGDVKLITAVGAFLGPYRLVVALLATALVGGVMAVAAALRKRALLRTVRSSGTVVTGLLWRLVGEKPQLPTLGGKSAIRIPYGVAIALGALVGLLV